MKRTFVRLAACFALTTIALATTNVHAGNHGRKHSAFAQSNGGGGNGGGNGPSMKSMKFQSGMSRNLSGLNANGGNGGGSGNGGNPSFNPSFARKMNKSFATNQGNGSLPSVTSTNKNLKFSKNTNSQLNSNLFTNPSFKANGRARRAPTNDVFDKSKLADAIKQGNFRPIDSGIGNGTGGNSGNGPQSGKFKGWDAKKFADVIKHDGDYPSDNLPGGIGKKVGDDKKFDPNWNDKFGGKFGDKFCDTPNQNKNCHNGFPWWKLWTNCYPNNCYPNNCYPNDWHCHYPNNCYPPIYYNYPPVTNVTVVNPLPPLPAQPTLVDGIDLELVDLRLVDLGDTAKGLGPRYRITYRNRGTLPAGNFQVMLLASTDGTPQPGLPSGVAEVAGAPSGQLLTVDVRLTPAPELSTMNNLIVALDTATQVIETEESNNVAVIDRTKVAMADLAVR